MMVDDPLICFLGGHDRESAVLLAVCSCTLLGSAVRKQPQFDDQRPKNSGLYSGTLALQRTKANESLLMQQDMVYAGTSG